MPASVDCRLPVAYGAEAIPIEINPAFEPAPPLASRLIERTEFLPLEFIVMITVRNFLFTAFFFAMSLSMAAQAQPTPSASGPSASVMMSQGCSKPMAKHDHGADKGTPRPMAKSGPCTAASASSADGAASSATAKKLPKHNHSAEKNH